MKQIIYEYIGERLIEDPEGLDKVFDDGSIRKGTYIKTWYTGSEICKDEDVEKRISILEKIKNEYGKNMYRNIKVKEIS